MRNARDGHLVFQNEAKNISSQDFVLMNISCEYKISTYDTLCSKGPTKLLADSRKMPVVAILFFKSTPRQDFMVMNISCKFEKSTYNILASRGVTRKSLHTAVAAY